MANNLIEGIFLRKEWKIMKKIILIVLIIILSKLSFVYADIYFLPAPLLNNLKVTQLEYLAGKIIYRDVPARNKTEFSKEYMNEYYELFSYNENLMELKDSNKKSIILARSLWDDGNWKDRECFYLTNFAPLKYNETKISMHSDNNTNHNCNCYYFCNQKYNLKCEDHVVWDKKCGHVLIFKTNSTSNHDIATIVYCRGKLSPFYCTARDEIEYIGVNNLIKSDKCFKYP